MAKRKKTTREASKRSAVTRRQNGAQDAIALLKGDHRQVESWFAQFEKTRSEGRKLELARNICKALTVHATIEEEIFYPAFLEATEDVKLHHEAAVEHDGAKKLIAKIEASSADDEYYDARVTVLSEMVKHHVKEEERRDGMFARARKSEMDLQELGKRLEARKAELMRRAGRGSSRPRGARGAGAAAVERSRGM
jgi:hemerythrin superfamily protein